MTRYFSLLVAFVMCSLSAGAAQDFPYREGRGIIPEADGRIPSELSSITTLLCRDTIYVASPVGYHPRSCEFVGRMVPDRVLRYLRQYYPEGPLYIAHRTVIGPGVSAYFLRVPDMYSSPNIIDLWVFNHKHGDWLPPVELARKWGDAGETWEQNSWLVDTDGDGYRDIVKRTRATYWDEIGNEIERDTLVLYLFTAGGFVPSTDPEKAPSSWRFEFHVWPVLEECPSPVDRRVPN